MAREQRSLRLWLIDCSRLGDHCPIDGFTLCLEFFLCFVVIVSMLWLVGNFVGQFDVSWYIEGFIHLLVLNLPFSMKFHGKKLVRVMVDSE